MNGIHDMGGMTDFGSVIPEEVTPVFHADWERRVFGLVFNLISRRSKWDEFRFALERIEPSRYLTASYYERWLTGLEGYLAETGVIAAGQLEAPSVLQPRPEGPIRLKHVASTNAESRFVPGDAVVTLVTNPPWHTRLPRYARGKHGIIHRCYGRSVFADANSAGLGEQSQTVYSVRFEARELWGPDAAERDSVFIDLWESYLEKAP